MRTVFCLLSLLRSSRPQSPVFYSIQFLVLILFIVVSTCIGTCFVKESIDSFPIFNSGFCPLLSFRVGKDDENVIITFDFLSVESFKEEEDF